MRILPLVSLCCAAIMQTSAQTACTDWYPLKPGTRFEMTTYDKKDRVTSVGKSEIKAVTPNAKGIDIEVALDLRDDKGKVLQDDELQIRCEEGILYLDLSQQFDPKMMASYQDMNVKITGNPMAIPPSLRAGQQLPDADCQMEVYNGGMRLLTMNYKATNRKVEGDETVITPAGSFKCTKVSYDMEVKAIIAAKGKVTQYLAPGIGVIKSENYDAKGNKTGYTVLTKWEP